MQSRTMGIGRHLLLNSSQAATWAESVAIQQETVPGSRARNRRALWASGEQEGCACMMEMRACKKQVRNPDV